MSESQLAEPLTCLNKIDWLNSNHVFFFSEGVGGGSTWILLFCQFFLLLCSVMLASSQSQLRRCVNAKREETGYWPFILPVCNFCKYRLMSKQLTGNHIPSVFYFGGARSKGFAPLRNVSKLPFFDKIGHAKSVGFGFIRLFDEVRAELVRDISRSLRFLWFIL